MDVIQAEERSLSKSILLYYCIWNTHELLVYRIHWVVVNSEHLKLHLSNAHFGKSGHIFVQAFCSWNEPSYLFTRRLCTCADYLIQSDINKNKIIILFYNTLWIKTGKKASILCRYKT